MGEGHVLFYMRWSGKASVRMLCVAVTWRKCMCVNPEGLWRRHTRKSLRRETLSGGISNTVITFDTRVGQGSLGSDCTENRSSGNKGSVLPKCIDWSGELKLTKEPKVVISEERGGPEKGVFWESNE